MRVPLGALTLMTNCPGSVRGKKATPSSGDKRQAEHEHAHDDDDRHLRTCQRLVDALVVLGQHVVVPAIERRQQSAPAIRGSCSPWASLPCSVLMKREQNSGTTDMATRYDAAKCQHHAQRQRGEQILAYAGEKHHREEHDRGGEGRRQNRQLHFLATIVRRRYARLRPPPYGGRCFPAPPPSYRSVATTPGPVRPEPSC